jgi:hypothetical protein
VTQRSAASGQQPAAASRDKPALTRLWIGVLLAPASWIADLLVRYLMIRFANTHDRRWLLHVPTIICLSLLLAGGYLCWRERRSAHGGDPSLKARATLAGWGLALAAYFLLLILTQAYPGFALSVQEIT